MGKITFVLGGARSGKSRFAIKLAGRAKSAAFIATGQGLDAEMEERIAFHRRQRPKGWRTFEEPKDLSALIAKIGNKFDRIVIDCLTLWASNMLMGHAKEKKIGIEMSGIMKRLKKAKAESIVISNEIGLGIVPENKLARDFRDIAGRINQIAAEKADEVYFMVSGLPWRIK